MSWQILLPVTTAIGGIFLMILGFLYDVEFAGIPPQDAPPSIQETYQRHLQLASTTMGVGLVVFIIGMAILLLVLALRRRQKAVH